MSRSISSASSVLGLLGCAFLFGATESVQAQECTDDCKECFSAGVCVGFVGDKCPGGECKAVETCPAGAKACCGCSRGSNIYFDDNERVAESDLTQSSCDDSPLPRSVRFFTAVEGSGEVQCGDCTTADGCSEAWAQAGKPAICTATPGDGARFLHWSEGGKFISDEGVVEFATKGATLKAHFVPVAETLLAESRTRTPSHYLTVLFRVYDPEGSPVDQAEIRIKTQATLFKWVPEKCRRGATVNGLWQCFVLCASAGFPSIPAPPTWPSQVRYEWEVWSAAGKTAKGSWWQPTNSWMCDNTKENTVRLHPI